MSNKYKVLKIMYNNDWHLLPNYPFKESLSDLEDSKEVEDYCSWVLKNMWQLAYENK